ncbi:MAG: MarR family transcriptional regulator [Planctomycetales bacterium]|nr:MarR family transcriptional regulator [Planctomycetales bacterium]
MRREKLAASVWIRLAKCYGLVLREVRRRGVREGLTLPQFDALAQLLRRRDGMSPTELSRALLVTAGNVTGIVSRLRTRGLVAREAHPHDGRAAVLRLTRPGLRVASTEVARQERLLGEILGPLPGTRQARLRAALEDLRLALDGSHERSPR